MTKTATPLRADLWLAIFLISLDVLVRLLPHGPSFTPVAASALFAGTMMRHRGIALAVPLAAMLLSDAVLGFYDWRVMAVVYAALMVPALAGEVARRFRLPRSIPLTAVGCSLLFFLSTNLAVWAFSGLYSLDMAGLMQCYVLALPFLKITVAGDLFWTAVLFGGAWLVQRYAARPRAVAAS